MKQKNVEEKQRKMHCQFIDNEELEFLQFQPKNKKEEKHRQ